MSPLAFELNHGGVIVPRLHSRFQFRYVLLRGLAVHFFINAPDPIKIVIPDCGGVAHHKGAILADNKGIDKGRFFLQRKGIGNITDGQLTHQGDAVLLTGNFGSKGHANQNDLFARTVIAYGDPILSVFQRF